MPESAICSSSLRDGPTYSLYLKLPHLTLLFNTLGWLAWALFTFYQSLFPWTRKPR
uniref:Uncharacterized protein n=1 Tax=Picea glauca TaxID=3330 RepID=A0A117NGY2_PICGL|nr:hypothetical protein ABT39_MTgene5684 [Picea glauca]